MKNGKVAGSDQITAELLNVAIYKSGEDEDMPDELTSIFNRIGRTA